MTAVDDQEAAARADLQARISAVLPPGTPRVSADSSTDVLYQRAAAALDIATDPAHPERRCPHVRGIRPYMLDMYRAVLGCGRCCRSDQLQFLPGDEEHRCDRCRALVAPADEHAVIMSVAGFITTAAMVCPPCWHSYVTDRATP